MEPVCKGLNETPKSDRTCCMLRQEKRERSLIARSFFRKMRRCKRWCCGFLLKYRSWEADCPCPAEVWNSEASDSEWSDSGSTAVVDFIVLPSHPNFLADLVCTQPRRLWEAEFCKTTHDIAQSVQVCGQCLASSSIVVFRSDPNDFHQREDTADRRFAPPSISQSLFSKPPSTPQTVQSCCQ